MRGLPIGIRDGGNVRKLDQQKIARELVKTALEFIHQDTVIRDFRKQLRPCADRESADWANNDPGVPECRYAVSCLLEDYCEPCKSREQNKHLYKAALRARSAAKRKMRRLAEQAEMAGVEDA